MNRKITDPSVPELINAVDDALLYIVDVLDLSEDVAGTSKKIKKSNLLKDKADLVDGKVPSVQLPSYVIEVENFESLPITGENGRIYVTIDNNKLFIWTGSVYVEASQGNTDHTQLTNIGINTHAQIDTALSRLANTSGTNTGDQDLSGLATNANLDLKANQDGTILYYYVKWFTPTGTLSNVGATVTSGAGQFTSAMVGAKLIINDEQRIITAFTSSTVVTVASPYSVNNTGVVAGSWGVYSRAEQVVNGSIIFYTTTGVNAMEVSPIQNLLYTNTVFLGSRFGLFPNNVAYDFMFLLGKFIHGSNSSTIFTNGAWNATADTGIRRNTAGVLEIFDGVALTGLPANRRDLLLRNLVASAIQATALPDSTGDALFTKMLTAKTDGTVGWEDKPPSVGLQLFSYSVEGGLIKKTLTIPSGVTTINNNAFNNTQITYVTLPNSVTSIGDYAFNGNELTTVTIPNSVTSIGNGAFNSNQLITVTIPSGVTTISSNAFSNNLLTTVTIPNSVTSIEDYAFGDNRLITVTIPNSVTSIGNGAFVNNQLTTVTLPNSVTSIGIGAFGNNQLTTVTIPSGVTTISSNAFSSNLLTSVTIPNSVTSIEDYAFSSNELTTVTIPNSVTSIGNGAFNSNQLITVTLPAGCTYYSNSFDAGVTITGGILI